MKPFELSPVSRALTYFRFVILGLAPQALCCRPLRGLLKDIEFLYEQNKEAEELEEG